jgi:imidazolonepropionase-like amidohydrolase
MWKWTGRVSGWAAGPIAGALAVALGCGGTIPGAQRPGEMPNGASRPGGAVDQSSPLTAIVHASIWTADARGTRIADGTLIMRDGRIIALGDHLLTPVPAGATVIDAAGRTVTPGLIDAHSHLGVYPSPSGVGHADGHEMTAPNTAEIQAAHAFWPQDAGLGRALRGGVTSMLILPGSANLFGGRGFSIKNFPGRSAAAMRFPGAPDVLKMACGENPKRVYGKKTGPQTRMGEIAAVRAAFVAAAEYRHKWEHWETRGRAKGDLPPPRDLKLETLADVRAGKILVQNHCYRADEMLLMLDVAEEVGYRIRAFHHAVEAYKIADVLAKKGVAVATWADWWGFKLEAFDGIQENLAMVQAAGGRAVVHSDSPTGIQHLNQAAAQGLAVGRAMGLALTEDDALRWITINPAWVLGVDAQTGSLAVGKMADVVLWSHPPLSIAARADQVFVDGRVAYDRGQGVRPSDFELGTPAQDAARGARP